jgi:hypothetical protein
MKHEKIDIIIVGGGPIGLAHAWGIKKINPNLQVVVIEKYEEYQRKHTVQMQHQPLAKLIEVTETQNDKAMNDLYTRLKKNAFISTSELENLLKKRAQDNGVKIIHEEIEKDTVHDQLYNTYPNAKLIIGADGTHSVVAETLFPKGNQVKHEFDYVLQLRYEIQGDSKANPIQTIRFFQNMARNGLISNEYVGQYNQETNTTPVTMQMMISKKAFETLKEATSKNPLNITKPNIAEESNPFLKQKPKNNLELADLPTNIQGFLTTYLQDKIKQCNNGEILKQNSIRISVNEAPATHAKQVFELPISKNIPIVLVGDASLGLSYFKGLNAGIESTAQLLKNLKIPLKGALNDIEKTKNALTNYQNWFLQDFSPKKIRVVAQYSTFRIRSFMTIIQTTKHFKNPSAVDEDGIQFAIIQDYFKLLATDPLIENKALKENLYPHRSYPLVHLGQWDYVPVTHSLIKIGKLFTDYTKPYKSHSQMKQDFKPFLAGLVNVSSGLMKIIVGLFTLNPKRFIDGIFSLLRGIIEIITAPLSMTIKPLIRSVITGFLGFVPIESMPGMRKLAENGTNQLTQLSKKEKITAIDIYNVLAICNDIHRKFDKATNISHQNTKIDLKEIQLFNDIRSNADLIHLDQNKLKDYFALFTPQSPTKGL